MNHKPCTREAVALLTATPLDEALAVLHRVIQRNRIAVRGDSVRDLEAVRATFAALGTDAERLRLAARLPDLPLLGQIHPTRHGQVVRDALRQVPGIVAGLRVRDLVDKYCLSQATASRVLRSVRGH